MSFDYNESLSQRESVRLGNTRARTSDTAPRQPNSRQELSALLTAETGPIRNLDKAQDYLESKGWVLAGEPYSMDKLCRILLTACISLSNKKVVATEHNAAHDSVLAVAFLLESELNDSISEQLMSIVSDKISAKVDDLTDKLSSAVTSTMAFLAATDKTHAECTITLSRLTDDLSTVSAKLNKIPTPSPQDPAFPRTWADVANTPPTSNPSKTHHLLSTYNPNATDTETRLQQHLLCAARTLLVEVNPTDPDVPKDRSPAGNNEIRTRLNNALKAADTTFHEVYGPRTPRGNGARCRSGSGVHHLSGMD